MGASGYREGRSEERRLVIPQRSFPLSLSIGLAVVFAAFGLGLLWRYTETHTMTCERDDRGARCTLRDGRLFLHHDRPIPVESLRTSVSSRILDETWYVITLDSSAGELDLGLMEDEYDAQVTAGGIDRFVQADDRGTFVFRGQRMATPVIAVGLGMLLVAGLAPLLSRRRDLELVVSGGRLRILRHGAKKIGETALGDVEDVTESLVVRTKQGELSLEGAFTTAASRARAAEAIRAFLRDA
ncbi:MAG: hypothetical protein ACXVEE_16140 [Polyangiales bacterium]